VAAARFEPVVGRDPRSGLSYRLATADLPAVCATAHERTRFVNARSSADSSGQETLCTFTGYEGGEE